MEPVVDQLKNWAAVALTMWQLRKHAPFTAVIAERMERFEAVLHHIHPCAVVHSVSTVALNFGKSNAAFAIQKPRCPGVSHLMEGLLLAFGVGFGLYGVIRSYIYQHRDIRPVIALALGTLLIAGGFFFAPENLEPYFVSTGAIGTTRV